MAQATTILTNGSIWLGKAEGFAQAIALAGDKVLASGTTAEVELLADETTTRIDLEGRFAMPGIYDAHTHLAMYGRGLRDIDAAPTAVKSLEEIYAKIAEKAKEVPEGGWIIARGYDHTKLAEGRHPHRTELDAAAPGRKVYVVRTCGHVAVANSLALQEAGIGHNTPNPDGGEIYRDASGLTGLLAENARFPVMANLPKDDLEAWVAGIEAGGKDMLRYGITSTMDAGVGMEAGWLEVEAYLEAKKQGRLPVRVAATFMGDKDVSILEEAIEKGFVTGVGCDMWKVGPVKFFTDGSAGSYTAAVTEPYVGTDNHGIFCLTDAECDALAKRAHDAGYQMAIHAIGDAAIEQILNAMEKAQTANPSAKPLRHRIEHCGWLADGQIERMVRLGVYPAPQPTFMYYFGENYAGALGQKRTDFAYPMRAFVDAGLEPSASTDCPVTALNPFAGIYGMVTRKTWKGTVIGVDQRLTVAEALHAYTYSAAFGTHDEEKKGRLIPGQLADIAVLSANPFEIDPEEILQLSCVKTLLGGKVVYEEKAAA